MKARVDFIGGDRLVSAKERVRLIPYSNAHWNRLEAAGQVPKRVRVGPNRVGWSLRELQDWIDTQQLEDAG